MRIIAFDLNFYALEHGTIKIALVDEDGLSLNKFENIHETGQIVSYRPENHRFQLEMSRPESWYR